MLVDMAVKSVAVLTECHWSLSGRHHEEKQWKSVAEVEMELREEFRQRLLAKRQLCPSCS